MRAALLIYGSLETVSGGYLYDRRLVEQLRARGHSVEIITLPWRNYARHLADNLTPAWRSRLQSLDVDLLLEDELCHPSLAFAPRPRRADGSVLPIVTIVHHLRSSEEHPPLLRPIYRAVEARYLHRATGFVFNSHTTCASVAALRTPMPSALVAYPAADHVRAADDMRTADHARADVISAADSQSLREASPPRGDALQVAFVGNIIRRKGLHTLVAALARADAPLMLHIAGSEDVEPKYAAAVRAQVLSAGLSDRVHFLGPLTNAALAQLYARCDLLAVPSYEGFGIVYLEAMAFGHPVIASTTGAAHEIVSAGENGFLVAPNDSEAMARYLTALARDPSLLAEMSAAAAATYAQAPTWAESTTRIAEFLEELVA